MGTWDLCKTKKWGGCHHLLLVYDATMLNNVHVHSKMTSSRPSVGT